MSPKLACETPKRPFMNGHLVEFAPGFAVDLIDLIEQISADSETVPVKQASPFTWQEGIVSCFEEFEIETRRR